MKKYLLVSAFVLVGCGSDDAAIVDEQFDAVVDDTTQTTETSAEDAVVESGDETAADAPAMDTQSETPSDAPAETAPDAMIAGIKCGMTSCDPATKVCCSSTTSGSLTCIDKTAACGGGKLSCSSQAGCPSGQNCCLGTAGLISGSECKSACGITETELCAIDADCSSGRTCKNLGGGSGFKTCQ